MNYMALEILFVTDNTIISYSIHTHLQNIRIKWKHLETYVKIFAFTWILS